MHLFLLEDIWNYLNEWKVTVSKRNILQNEKGSGNGNIMQMAR